MFPFGRGAACGTSGSAVAIPNPDVDSPLSAVQGAETAVVAGGCFWGIQAVFEHVKGVIGATSGYSGGAANTATYEKVCSGRTGHAEAVQVVFDPSQISFGQILKVFFSVRTIRRNSTGKGRTPARSTGRQYFLRPKIRNASAALTWNN